MLLEGYDESGGPPYGEAPEPPRAMMPRPPDEDRLRATRQFLGEREEVSQLGSYDLYTDCGDRGLLAHLDALAARVDAAYAARYGLRPLGEPQAALVLYASELPYRVLQRRSRDLVGLHSTGHANRGLAVLYVGDRGRAEVGATVVHELAHLVSRRALGPALPPWLDEGVATDLATVRFEDGGFQPERLSGDRRSEGGRVRIGGGLANLVQVHRAMSAGDAPALAHLLGLDWQGFVRTGRSRLHYSSGALWIRYLLQGAGGRHAVGFQRFLAAVGRGEPPSAEALLDHLGPSASLSALEEDFRAWIRSEVERLDLLAFSSG